MNTVSLTKNYGPDTVVLHHYYDEADTTHRVVIESYDDGAGAEDSEQYKWTVYLKSNRTEGWLSLDTGYDYTLTDAFKEALHCVPYSSVRTHTDTH